MKVGIITMHRPISYGSALQAYALQTKIESLGYTTEIIDYQYPNKLHLEGTNPVRRFLGSLISLTKHAFLFFPNIRKAIKFRNFRNRYLNLSQYYPTADHLSQKPPVYDIYMTGSDQVWNANFTKSDASFLLGFVQEGKPRISYGSSFAIKEIPEEYKSIYQENLSHYNEICVRVENGIILVKELVNKEAKLVCDPTLLLTAKEWDRVANTSKLKITQSYILVFMLRYSFSPYPEARRIISKIQKELGLPVIYLNGIQEDYFKKHSKVIKAGGPDDFIVLIKNASYVITDSFHGVVFSSIFERPLSAIVKTDNSDSRVMSYLKTIGWEHCVNPYNSLDIRLNKPGAQNGINSFREHSAKVLKEMIQKY